MVSLVARTAPEGVWPVFASSGVSEKVVDSLDEMGFEEPTPVQQQTIPLLLQNRDVVAQALTGTGKTAAYGIALVERVDTRRVVPQAVVLAPTRELAVQISDQLGRMRRHSHLVPVSIYGGQPIERQLHAPVEGCTPLWRSLAA
jgi:ATP-dependent RNA helicase DeaD